MTEVDFVGTLATWSTTLNKSHDYFIDHSKRSKREGSDAVQVLPELDNRPASAMSKADAKILHYSTLLDPTKVSLKTRKLMEPALDSSAFEARPATSSSRVGKAPLSGCWADSVNQIKQNVYKSLPRSSKLTYLRTSSFSQETSGSFRTSVHNSTSSPSKLDNPETKITKEPRSTSPFNEEHLADPMFRRLHLFRGFLEEFVESHPELGEAIHTIMSEFEIVLHKLLTELSKERDKSDRDHKKPSVLVTKEELREKVKLLTTEADHCHQQLSDAQEAGNKLRQSNRSLSLANGVLCRELKSLKSAIVTVFAGTDGGNESGDGLPKDCLHAKTPNLEQEPIQGFVELMQRVQNERSEAQSKASELESQIDLLKKQLATSEADVLEFRTKFDRLAKLYESQWRELRGALLTARQMSADYQKYAEVRDALTKLEREKGHEEAYIQLLKHEYLQQTCCLSHMLQATVRMTGGNEPTSIVGSYGTRGLPIDRAIERLNEASNSSESPRGKEKSARPPQPDPEFDWSVWDLELVPTEDEPAPTRAQHGNELSVRRGSAMGARRASTSSVTGNTVVMNGMGMSNTVPSHLRCDPQTVLSFARLTKTALMKIIKEIWKERSELSLPRTPPNMSAHLTMWLTKKHASKTVTEHAYAIDEACKRFGGKDSVVWLFMQVLNGFLPEDLHFHLAKTIETLQNAAEKFLTPSEYITCNNLFGILEAVLSTKSQERMLRLRAAILAGNGFSKSVTRANLREVWGTGAFATSIFVEELRRQTILEYEEYFAQLKVRLLGFSPLRDASVEITVGQIGCAMQELDPGVDEAEVLRRIRLAVPPTVRAELAPPDINWGLRLQMGDFLRHTTKYCFMTRASTTVQPLSFSPLSPNQLTPTVPPFPFHSRMLKSIANFEHGPGGSKSVGALSLRAVRGGPGDESRGDLTSRSGGDMSARGESAEDAASMSFMSYGSF